MAPKITLLAPFPESVSIDGEKPLTAGLQFPVAVTAVATPW